MIDISIEIMVLQDEDGDIYIAAFCLLEDKNAYPFYAAAAF
jgi:hypothetical protein